jgi:dsRNA-specific ribonuclease
MVAARVHDVGMLAVPPSELHQESGMDRPTQHLIRVHPTLGARWIERLGADRAIVAAVAAHPHRALPASILADAFEALIAAVYLDAGVATAYEFVLRHIEKQIERTCREIAQHNAKSLLQEWVQRQMNSTPVYKVTAETGPDHVKSFEVVTLIAGKPYGAGQGATKKAAEQMAAELTLKMLGQRTDKAEG